MEMMSTGESCAPYAGAGETLDWLDEEVRARGIQAVKLLFHASPISIVVFDAQGIVTAVHAVLLVGHRLSMFTGVDLLSHAVLRHFGWEPAIRAVLAGERVELSDKRWVTLLTGEEHYIDIMAAPITDGPRVRSGVVFLVDRTAKHRATELAETKNAQARAIEVFLVHEVARPLQSIESWMNDETHDDALARFVAHLRRLLDDVKAFVRLSGYEIKPTRVLLDAIMRASCADSEKFTGAPGGESIAAIADPRLLRYALENILEFAVRNGGGTWTLGLKNGRARIEVTTALPAPTLRALLEATSLSAARRTAPRTASPQPVG